MLDHAQSRVKVCAVCYNRCCKKVDSIVESGSRFEGGLREFVDSEYSASDVKQPCGLCFDCKFRLSDWISRKANPRPLRITTGVELGQLSGETSSSRCRCHICWLASLFGPELMKARASFKQEKGEVSGAELRRCNLCFAAVMKNSPSKHICGGKKAMFENLTEALPEETRLQFALYTLHQSQVGGSGDSSSSFKVQGIAGGKPSTICLGNPKSSSSSYQLTHEDIQTLATDAHLSTVQTLNVVTNLRSVLGRSLAAPGLHLQLSAFNGRFLQFFTCERVLFEKGGTMVERPFFYCNDTVQYLKLVTSLRGQDWDDITLLIQGDSGPVVEKVKFLGICDNLAISGHIDNIIVHLRAQN